MVFGLYYNCKSILCILDIVKLVKMLFFGVCWFHAVNVHIFIKTHNNNYINRLIFISVSLYSTEPVIKYNIFLKYLVIIVFHLEAKVKLSFKT